MIAARGRRGSKGRPGAARVDLVPASGPGCLRVNVGPSRRRSESGPRDFSLLFLSLLFFSLFSPLRRPRGEAGGGCGLGIGGWGGPCLRRACCWGEAKHPRLDRTAPSIEAAESGGDPPPDPEAVPVPADLRGRRSLSPAGPVRPAHKTPLPPRPLLPRAPASAEIATGERALSQLVSRPQRGQRGPRKLISRPRLHLSPPRRHPR